MFTPFSAPPTPRERPLACEVARIDVLHISKIDQIEHAFSARLFIQLILRGGQHDAALLEGFNEPAPEFSLRPSATWLLHQFHFPNALKLEFAERKVTKMGADDLHMILRVDGTFLQHFQLHDFPYDSQTLQVPLSGNLGESRGISGNDSRRRRSTSPPTAPTRASRPSASSGRRSASSCISGNLG